jgi:hypothetical protein
MRARRLLGAFLAPLIVTTLYAQQVDPVIRSSPSTCVRRLSGSASRADRVRLAPSTPKARPMR